MTALTIADIKEWLIENRDDYQKLREQEFPPFDNEMYSMYGHLKDFIEYYKFRHKCNNALQKLNAIYNSNFNELAKWTQKYEILGSQDLLMFEVNYINWDEDVSIDTIKIHKGLYTERKPFANVLCFCKVFQHLYWDNCIQEAELNENEKVEVVNKLKTILKTYYTDPTHG
jgi:hypothetical protein